MTQGRWKREGQLRTEHEQSPVDILGEVIGEGIFWAEGRDSVRVPWGLQDPDRCSNAVENIAGIVLHSAACPHNVGHLRREHLW